MTDADLVALLDAVVNHDAVVVLENHVFDVAVHITGACVIRDCSFPLGLTVGRGGSIRFEGTNLLTTKGKTYTVERGAIYNTEAV